MKSNVGICVWLWLITLNYNTKVTIFSNIFDFSILKVEKSLSSIVSQRRRVDSMS